ncbi:MAG: hypothetical protein QW514_05995 [Thermoprotei archaeon]
MPSVTLEALLVLATTIPLILFGFTYALRQPICTLSFNPLTQINNAVQAAYTQPYTQLNTPINATLIIVAHGNMIKYSGCQAPPPIISDPDKIILSFGSNYIDYNLKIRGSVMQTPCNLIVWYNTLNQTLLVGCS